MTVLVQFGVLIAVATSLGHAAALGASTAERHGRTSWLFAAGGLCCAWEALFAGMELVGILSVSPRLAAMPLLISSFAAPLLMLFLRSIERGKKGLGLAWGLLLLGVPGLLVAVATLFDPTVGETWHRTLMAPEAATTTWRWLALGISTMMGPLLVMAGLTSLLATGRRAGTPLPQVGVIVLAALVCLGPPLWLGAARALTLADSIGQIAPAFTLPFSYLAWHMLQGTNRAIGQLSDERALLRRYLPSSVIDRIKTGSALSGAEAEVTILFSDIRGFTTLSESLDPQELISLLRDYLGTMAQVAQLHHGVVDKFIGDAILVVFGLDSDAGDDAVDAMHCARDMLIKLEAFNRRRARDGHAPLSIGIGLHRGRVVHGSIGSADRMEYTVVGDTVNTASRCESMTKELGLPILATQQVLDALPLRERANLDPLGSFDVRGRSSTVTLWSVRPIAVPTTGPEASWTHEPAPHREAIEQLEQI